MASISIRTANGWWRPPAQVQADTVFDKVVFVFNFADYLRTIAPANK